MSSKYNGNFEPLSITLGGGGPTYTYLDSGVPPTPFSPYTTIIAVHGLAYNAHIFRRVVALAPTYGVRVIALNRRGYGGSTPDSTSQTIDFSTASSKEKTLYLRSLGAEFASFVAQLVKKNDIPPATADGKYGGIAFLPWSSGHTPVLAALANLECLSDDVQDIFRTYVRRMIMEEPPNPILGLPMPPKVWFYDLDTTIPADQRRRMGTIWISSYFDHGDLSTHDLDAITYINPSLYRTPTIYNMTREEIAVILDDTIDELRPMMFCTEQAHETYLKVCFDSSTKERLPHLRIHVTCGTRGPSFSPSSFWLLKADDKGRGGGHIVFREVEGVNHFMHWDEPELAMQVYLEALA